MWFLWVILGMVILAGVEVLAFMGLVIWNNWINATEIEHVADMMPPMKNQRGARVG